MATFLNTKIKCYLVANSKTYTDEKKNYSLQNDGQGDYIKSWNVSGLAEPTQSQLDAFQDDADAMKASATLIGTRRRAYLTWREQLDMMWHDKKDGTTTWEDAIQAVKDANPKA